MNKRMSKVIDIARSLKESPTVSVGDGGYTNSATATGPVSGYDAPLPLPTLDQDYQTPGESGLAKYRFSNVYPAQQVTDKGVDNMVDASSEYLKLADEGNQRQSEQRVNRIREMVRSLREEMAVGANGLTGAANPAGPLAGYDPVIGKIDRRNKKQKNYPKHYVQMYRDMKKGNRLKSVMT
jgi:hypothetical protein|tara:strand:- start:826 stop:1368 length:543 start_codon:yes stop_codon:yes gene_type:complete